jgi:hypothetical protein
MGDRYGNETSGYDIRPIESLPFGRTVVRNQPTTETRKTA